MRSGQKHQHETSYCNIYNIIHRRKSRLYRVSKKKKKKKTWKKPQSLDGAIF